MIGQPLGRLDAGSRIVPAAEAIAVRPLADRPDATPPAPRRAAAAFALEMGDRCLEVELATDLAGLAALRPAWRALWQEAVPHAAFLSWEWLYSWSEQFVRGTRRLFVLAISDGTEVIGIAPWYVESVACGPLRVREVGFLGLPDAGSDYLDVLARRNREMIVAQALVKALFGPLRSSWDTLVLRDVPAESPFLSRLLAELRRRGKHYSVAEGSFCPGVRLPPTFEAYQAEWSSHGRQAYRRKMRALQSDGAVEHTILTGVDQVGSGLETFREIYERRWGGRTAVSEGLFALVTGYLPRADTAWQVELSLLHVGGRAVAGLLHLTRGEVMHQYLMAVDRTFNRAASIGTLICGMNIERAIGAGYAEYDFLKAEEDYKFQFMNQGRRALNVTVHNRTLRSLASLSVGAAQAFGKVLLR